MPSPSLPDAPPGNWVDTRAPSAWRPYLRLMRADRPIGTWLLLLPCWWGAALATLPDGAPRLDFGHLVLFAIGAFVMRGAGCVWNDITDRDIDARVARTAGRPLPSGAVTVRAAVLFMACLLAAGLLVLLQFNLPAILIGLSSILIIAAYPFMKRISDFPQLVLGLAFNWGVLVAWAAVHGDLGLAPLLLYSAGIAWTLGYDTIYALQDIDDDAIVGVRSTARYFGTQVMTAISFFYAAAILFVVLALLRVAAGPASYVGAIVFAFTLARQVMTLDPSNERSALAAFRANRSAGLVFFLALAADGWLRASPYS